MKAIQSVIQKFVVAGFLFVATAAVRAEYIGNSAEACFQWCHEWRGDVCEFVSGLPGGFPLILPIVCAAGYVDTWTMETNDCQCGSATCSAIYNGYCYWT